MDNLQVLTFPGFSILVSANWTSSSDVNDPHTFFVSMDETDEFRITIGAIREKPEYFQDILVEDVTIEEIVDAENGGEILEEKRTIETSNFHSDVQIEMVSNRAIQCLVPKQSGHGASGVFFETFDVLNGTNTHVRFLGFNLKPENENHFFCAIRTLKFDH